MIPIKYVSLEFLWNKKITLPRYKAKIIIATSARRTTFIFTGLNFSIRMGSLHLYWLTILHFMENLPSDISLMSLISVIVYITIDG